MATDDIPTQKNAQSALHGLWQSAQYINDLSSMRNQHVARLYRTVESRLAHLEARCEELERDLAKFHAAIELMSIGIATQQVDLWFKPPGDGDPTLLHPERVEGIMRAIKLATQHGAIQDFGREAIKAYYEIDDVRARCEELERERDQVNAKAKSLINMVSCDELPDSGCGQNRRCLMCQIQDSRKDRDEARAELERLRNELDAERIMRADAWRRLNASADAQLQEQVLRKEEDMRFPNLRDKDYLGDGVYVGHDGYQVVLWIETTGAYGRDAIALDHVVLQGLNRYVERLRSAARTEENEDQEVEGS